MPKEQGPPLPPPAFPPWSRRAVAQPRSAGTEPLPEGAFISPDEPVRRISGEFPDGAIISPDEPVRHREPLPGITRGEIKAPAESVVTRGVTRGEATGIGERHRSLHRPTSGLAPGSLDLSQAAQVMEDLAKRMRQDGADALLPEYGISRFEGALRSFLNGYLARRD